MINIFCLFFQTCTCEICFAGQTKIFFLKAENIDALMLQQIFTLIALVPSIVI